MNFIQTITLEVLCYGPPPSVNKVRKILGDLLDEERPDLDTAGRAALIQEQPAAEVAAELTAQLLESDVKLPGSGGKRIGLSMRLPELNEQITSLYLAEMEVAKTCACICSWDSPNKGGRYQMAYIGGEKAMASREQ